MVVLVHINLENKNIINIKKSEHVIFDENFLHLIIVHPCYSVTRDRDEKRNNNIIILLVAIRRAINCRQPNNVTNLSSIISTFDFRMTDGMHTGILAAAAHAVATNVTVVPLYYLL